MHDRSGTIEATAEGADLAADSGTNVSSDKVDGSQKVECANCGADVGGAYCSNCGQKTHLHRSVRGFLHDMLHGVMHFDGKLWRTLPMLAWKPGELTRRYIDGERARFFSPIAIFLFIAFCTYIGFSLLSTSVDPDLDLTKQAEAAATQTGYGETDASDRAGATAGDDATPVSEKANSVIVFDGAESDFAELPRSVEERVARAVRNPALTAYKVQTNAYKFAWALIPLSAPFVWLLFFWRGIPMYDHIVFTTYSIAFMTALGGVAALMVTYVAEAVGGTLLLFAPVHLYKHLKGTYALTRFGALWRLLVLSMFIWIVIGVFVMLIGIGAA